MWLSECPVVLTSVCGANRDSSGWQPCSRSRCGTGSDRACTRTGVVPLPGWLKRRQIRVSLEASAPRSHPLKRHGQQPAFPRLDAGSMLGQGVVFEDVAAASPTGWHPGCGRPPIAPDIWLGFGAGGSVAVAQRLGATRPCSTNWQLGNPLSILHVRFASRHGLHVCRVEQPTLQVFFQAVEAPASNTWPWTPWPPR
jgi:hypothetical protein